MNLQELREYCRQKIADFPHLKGQITDFYTLACDEVEQGESEWNECELAVSDIENLITED